MACPAEVVHAALPLPLIALLFQPSGHFQGENGPLTASEYTSAVSPVDLIL